MNEVIIFLLIYISSLLTKMNIDKKSKNKIENECKKIAIDAGVPLGMIEEYEDKLLNNKLSIKDFLPIVNIIKALKYYFSINKLIKEFKVYLENIFPKLYFKEVEKRKEVIKSNEVLKKKEYFIGKMVDNRFYNISFAFDGYDIYIHDNGNWFSEYDDKEKIDLLLKLLYIWYNGGSKELNGSNNLNEVFTDDMIKSLKHRYAVNNFGKEEEIVRKRVR